MDKRGILPQLILEELKMSERVLFVSPAKLYPVDGDGEPLQQVRQNVSLPALTVLGSLKCEGFDVDFMDLVAEGYGTRKPVNKYVYRVGLPDEAVSERIIQTKPSALLVSSMFSTEQSMVDDLTARVNYFFPDLPIIVGGTHATLKPDWTLESRTVDFVVLGEGEDTIVELLNAIKEGNPERVEHIAYRKDGKIITNGERAIIGNLNRPQALDEVLLRGEEYRYKDDSSRRSTIYNYRTKDDWNRDFALSYSRGCPTHCDYCTSTERSGSIIRHMGAERMFADFKLLHEKHGVRIFYNQADTFGLHPKDIEFLKKVKEYRKEHSGFVINNPNASFVKIFFPQSKGYELDEEMLDLYQEAGFNVMTIAVETFNQRLNNIKKINYKDTPPEKIKDLLMAISARGMKTELYMMYAFPGQTKEELHRDEKIVQTLLPYVDEVAWQSCMVFPGTEYYNKALKEGWNMPGMGKFTEKRYRHVLDKGYFFHQLPEALNFSKIPYNELKSFRERHAPNF